MVQTTEQCPLSIINEWYVSSTHLGSVLTTIICHKDKTIKLWKVFERSIRVVSKSNHFDGHNPVSLPRTHSGLRLPDMSHQETIVTAVPRKVYANAHAYHINSISINSDGETYISADDLRVNLWNLNISDQSFSRSLSVSLQISGQLLYGFTF